MGTAQGDVASGKAGDTERVETTGDNFIVSIPHSSGSTADTCRHLAGERVSTEAEKLDEVGQTEGEEGLSWLREELQKLPIARDYPEVRDLAGQLMCGDIVRKVRVSIFVRLLDVRSDDSSYMGRDGLCTRYATNSFTCPARTIIQLI
eukprot:8605168-Pyramimonas_sp.AAC.3